MANELQAQSEPAIDAVLKKLDPEDRAVVLGALARAEKTEAELRYIADHDSLTGLLDRRRFRAELDQYVSFSARYGGQGAVMIIDIDGLKAINDALGHHAGDNLIRRIAEIMRERVRTTDIVARLSGDEFAVLMPQTDTAGALQLGEDLRAQVAESAAPAPDADSATISVGITMFGGERRGRRRRRFWWPPTRRCTGPRRRAATRSRSSRTPASRKRHPRRSQTTSARIRDALTHDRLSLHTQPIRSLASGGIERYELLLRMTGEDGELLPAASFIEVAERAGMVQELDRWVVARALELIAERERAGQPVSLHVNLSGASITDLSVLEFIERRLDEGDADPARVHLRDHRDGAGQRLRGSGRLRRPAHRVRLPGGDRRLRRRVRALPLPEADPLRRDQDRRRASSATCRNNDADQLTVQAIVQIARGLGKTTIAEYVQDDATTQMLREYGVDMAQGYHLGRPMDAVEALAAAVGAPSRCVTSRAKASKASR